ncbi:unnamed protein product [Pseudo-nitzschia multistriata]|uniref:histone acetyltransferase n=1 Tax=Pseudo-nitzschia multistriata TaxID=183589 RepID=A0A448Z5Q0_9STRA|nr:unnamed protein product [Pseudo-nitzschia multistriata]
MHPNMAPQMHRNSSSNMGMPPSMSQQPHDGRMMSSSSGRNQQYNMGNAMGVNGGGSSQNQMNNSMNGRSLNSSMENSMNGMGNTMNNNSMNGTNSMNAPMNNNINTAMNAPMGGNSMNAMNGNSMSGTMNNGMNSSRNNSMMNSRGGSGSGSSGLNGNWQTDRDTPHRRTMIQHIVKMLKKDKTGSPEWLDKLPQMAKQLEVSLYRNARSFEAYVDMTTLKQRLQQIAQQVSQKTRGQDSRRDRQPQSSSGMRQGGTSSSYMSNSSANRTDRNSVMNSNGVMSNAGGGMTGAYPRAMNNPSSTNSGVQSAPGMSTNGGGSGRNNDPEWKVRIRHKQQRLLLLHHSAKCPHEDGLCPITPHCVDMKRLWRHMEGCKDNRCNVRHCFSSRAILSHYRKCKDAACPACGPVRETVRKSQSNRGSTTIGSNRPSSSTGNMPNLSSGPQPRMRPNDVGNHSNNAFSSQPMNAQSSFSQPQQQQVPNMAPPSSNNANSGMMYPPPLLDSTKSTQASYRSGGGAMNGVIGSDFTSPGLPTSSGGQSSNYNQTASSSSSSRRNDSEWQKVRHKQQRLLLLRHASKCEHKTNCPVTPHCANMKKLWEHIAHCKDQQCNVPHCMSSRYVLSHYRRCKDAKCPACGPVRETIRRSVREQGNRAVQTSSLPSFDNAAPPDAAPPAKRQKLPTPRKPQAPAVVPSTKPKPVPSVVAPPKVTKAPSPAPPTNKGSEDRSLLDSFTLEQIETHLASLNRVAELSPAKWKKVCLEVLKGLQTHEHGWVFNSPVDPVELNLTDYFEIIKNPMDLGSIQKKLEKGEYHAIKDFQSDVNLSFDNAILYNGKGTVVYDMAKELKKKFEVDYSKLVEQLKNGKQNERACILCGCEKRLFEPPVFFCNGMNCASKRIRRNSHFYIGGNNQYYWCNQCYNDLDPKASIDMIDLSVKKSDLKKKKNDEIVEESWVQCDICERWIHQICGLFNTRQNKEHHSEYCCPLCLLDKRKVDKKPPLPRPAGATELPRTKLSEFIEARVKKKIEGRQQKVASEKSLTQNISMEEAMKETKADGGPVTIRQVTSMDRKLEVFERMRKKYAHKKYPEEFTFRCKCLLVFQEIDGVDVVLFALYLYEHGEDNPLPNKRTVYISYLDNVHYMRPRKIRTFVYHEILISYLDYARQRGFATVHIWACPPLKGDDYVFYAKPDDQKTPRDSRLRQWYLDMLTECQNRGIVGKVTNMYDLYFANESLDATTVPYHEGDYFPGEAENIIKKLEDDSGKKNGSSGKKKKQKNQSKSKNRGGTRSTGVDEEALIASGMINAKDLDRDKVMVKLGESILPMKESFLVAFLMWSGVKEEDTVVPEEIVKYREEHPEMQAPLAASNKRNVDGLMKEDAPLVDSNGCPIKVIDDDAEDLDCEILNNRQAFLNLCKGNHYQFDELRRAKHTSMMVLWHLQNRDAPKYVQQCVACSREILSGKRYHCNFCPDYDLCETCYKDPNTNRGTCTHKLEEVKLSDGQSESSGLTAAERKQRQRNLVLHIQLIEHASQCKSKGCNSKNCAKMKEYLQHAHTCKTKVVGGCRICKRIWTLLRIHAQKCKEAVCPVPQCKTIRDKMRELRKQQQAMDDRRRQEMNRHYRRGNE